MPRPVPAQQFTQGFFARGSDPPPRGSEEHQPQRVQSALSEQLRRNVHERIRASRHPATNRLWTRRGRRRLQRGWATRHLRLERRRAQRRPLHQQRRDRKSTRLNSSHTVISYAVFCLKKKKKNKNNKKV